MGMNYVRGYIETEYIPLINGGDIDIDYFNVDINELKSKGFETLEAFAEFIRRSPKNKPVGVDYKEIEMDKSYIYPSQFLRRDGYNIGLRCGGKRINF